MRHVNIAHAEERRINFETSMTGHTKSGYLWAIFAISITALLVFIVLRA